MEIKDKEWIKEHLADLEADVEDSEKSLDQAVKELKDAKEWKDKMQVSYAESIIRLFNFKKEQNLK